jgi:hypothetical protein
VGKPGKAHELRLRVESFQIFHEIKSVRSAPLICRIWRRARPARICQPVEEVAASDDVIKLRKGSKLGKDSKVASEEKVAS